MLRFWIDVPRGAGSEGPKRKLYIRINNADNTGASAKGATADPDAAIGIGANGATYTLPLAGADIGLVRDRIITMLNGGATGTAMQKGTDVDEIICGFEASAGSGAGEITLTATHLGAHGNKIQLGNTAGTIATTGYLAGGAGGAVPILRGVLLAPSGVILNLSGNF